MNERTVQHFPLKQGGTPYVSGDRIDGAHYDLPRASESRIPLVEFHDDENEALRIYVAWMQKQGRITIGDIINAFVPGQGELSSLVSYHKVVSNDWRKLVESKPGSRLAFTPVNERFCLVQLPELKLPPL